MMTYAWFHGTASPGGQTTSAARLTYDLYLDLPWLEAAAQGKMKEAVEGFFAKLDQMPPPKRLFLPAFQDGKTFFPPKDLPFAQDKRCQGLNLLREFSHRAVFERKWVVYGIADLLWWAMPGTPPEEDLFVKFPALQELNMEFSCDEAREGKFASPFHPQVWQMLIALGREIGRQYPPLNGLLIQCRLSLHDLLGYSEAARAAYIRAYQVDPVDLDEKIRDVKNPAAIGHWASWRRRTIADLVGAVSRAFRSVNPRGHVAARGIAPYYQFSPARRNMTRQDWLEWAIAGHIDEVLLHANWLDARNQSWLRDGMKALQRAQNKRIYVNPLLVCRGGGKPLSLSEQWVRLEQQVVWQHVVVALQHPDDLEAVHRFVKAFQ